MNDERIRHESLQKGPHKTQYSVNYVVNEERQLDLTRCQLTLGSSALM